MLSHLNEPESVFRSGLIHKTFQQLRFYSHELKPGPVKQSAAILKGLTETTFLFRTDLSFERREVSVSEQQTELSETLPEFLDSHKILRWI